MARAPRNVDRLARRQPVRPPYARVLIVCEGEKTEPLYLDDIRRANRIPTTHIVIAHGGVTEPRQIVDFAEREFRANRAFDRVFAVFDRDQHLTYISALDRAAALDGTLRNDDGTLVPFKAVPSVPCFELWLLLHFEDVHAFWHRSEVYQRVRGHIAGYEKGSHGVYARTEASLAQAAQRSERLRERFDPRTGEDPVTDVDILVSLLRSIRLP
jgi:hypothetical protein